jgi:hypothetical protein
MLREIRRLVEEEGVASWLSSRGWEQKPGLNDESPGASKPLNGVAGAQTHPAEDNTLGRRHLLSHLAD